MRRYLSARWLAFLLIAAALVVSGAPVAQAAPAQQEQSTVDIVVFSYVDVAGNPGPGFPAPACNLAFDPEDETYAQSNPLPSHTFVLKGAAGNEIETQATTELATLQRARFEGIPEEESFVLELQGAPPGWQLCPQESASLTLTSADFSLGRARATFHFFVPAQVTPGPGDTATPTMTAQTPMTPMTPTPTWTPGGPTPTPMPPPTLRPTFEPRPTEADGDEPEEAEPGLQTTGCTGLSAIKGLAFIDQNADGKLGPVEPGLNDVEVHLHGGGLQISQITPSSGQYSFEGLGAGEYDVFVKPGPEWKVTTPMSYKVAVSCEVVMGYDFGLIRHTDVPAEVAPAAPAPGAGIRLPDAGVMDLPRAPLFGGLALALAVLGLVGLTAEKWRARRP